MYDVFIDFVHTEEGVRCLEEGLSDLRTESECRKALAYARKFSPGVSFADPEHSKYSPKGCYVGKHKNKLHWNTNGGSGTYVWARSICKSGTNDNKFLKLIITLFQIFHK